MYSEKAIATSSAGARGLLELAARNGVTYGGAPDTFLGTWGTTAKHLVETGAVGEIVAASACFPHNRVENRHPDPRAFFELPGGGPLLDTGTYLIAALVHLLGRSRRSRGGPARARRSGS